MKWRKGKPDAPGLWVCYQNGECVVARVTVDTHPGGHGRLLRVTVDGDSWPLAEYPWGLSPSFGPIKARRSVG